MLDAIRWDAGLLRRYYQAGPRYTCYPSALQFNERIGAFALLRALRSSRQAQRPLSLFLHLPFCAASCACNTASGKDRSAAQAYLQRLEREIDLVACHLGAQQRVEQLHVGGGTPTFLSHAQLRRLMGHLRQRCNLRDDDGGDYGIEIDPRETDWATMGLLRELGFNRVSLGVQDLDAQVQRAVNRIQSLAQVRSLVEAARTLQFRSINIDLIYGLPKQTPHSFARTMEAIVELQPDRLSLFDYAHLTGAPLLASQLSAAPALGVQLSGEQLSECFETQRRINSQHLPDQAEKLAMLQNCIEQLTAAGYRYIGMGHFVLPDDELALAQESGRLHCNFQGYSSHGHCDLIGFGLSAISQVGDLYAQNSSDLALYRERLDSGQLASVRGVRCSQDDQIRRAVMETLFCEFELDFRRIESRFNLVFRDYFAAAWPALEQMARDGVIILGEDFIDIRPAGRLLARALCQLFDGYCADHQASLDVPSVGR